MLLKEEDPEDPEVSTPKNLTGFTAKAQVRASVDAPSVVAEFVIKNAPLGSDGKISLRLESTATNAFRTNPNGVWDLEITRTSDTTKLTVLEGIVTVKKDVTRDS